MDGGVSCPIFWVTVTLTSDLVFRIFFFGTYLLYYLRWESQICVHPFVIVTLRSDLVFRIGIVSGAYLLYSLRQEFRIWCVDGEVLRTMFWSL